MNKVEYTERDGQRFALVPADDWEILREYSERLLPVGRAGSAATEAGTPHFVLLALLSGNSRLKAWRRYRGLLQKELADRVGVARNYFTMIESGGREGSAQVWQSIAAALDVPISVLMEGVSVSDAHTAPRRDDKAELAKMRQHVYAQAEERNISLIRAWRLQLNLTRRQVAERMGVKEAAIGKIECKPHIRLSTIRRVAKALAIPVEYLIP